MSVKAVLAVGSSAACSTVTPTASVTVPLTLGSLVMPSVARLPVSFCRAAASAGAVVSTTTGASRTTVSVLCALLPATSAAVNSRLLLPSTRLMPAKLKLPSPAAVALPSTVLLPAARSVSSAPASAWPCRVTGLALVRRSPAVPVSLEAARPKLATAGAWVSSVKATLTVLVLPAASLATRRRVCAPWASVPPARLSSWARLRLNAPPACTLARMSVNVGLAAGSSAASNWVTPTASVTVPLMAGSLVMPSVARLPVSVCRAAASAGGVVSGMASRTMLRLPAVVLPAASATLKSKPLLPSTRAMPAKLKLPSPAAVVLANTVLLPVRRRVTAAPASVWPTRVTGLVVVRLSPSTPLSLAAASPNVASTGATLSAGSLASCGSVAGSTSRPPTRTVVGNSGATTLVLPSSAPPTISSCSRCTGVPSCRSLPSPSTPLTGSTLTIRLLSTKSPLMRTRANVPALKLSALAPLPPSAASSPRSAPINRCRPRAEPPTCSSCRPAMARSPDASPLVTSCTSVLLMLTRQAAAVLPAVMLLARPCTLHSPPVIVPPTCTVASV